MLRIIKRLLTSTGAFHDREYAFSSLGYFAGKTFIKYSNNDNVYTLAVLTDEIKFANKDMDDARKGLAESAEIKAAAEGDLGVTTKALRICMPLATCTWIA